MEADQEVVAAWDSLREHWLIPTTGKKAPKNLFYNFPVSYTHLTLPTT